MDTSNLQPHQQRVVDEKLALDEKLEKLVTFSKTETFANLHRVERTRLQMQAFHMGHYSNILGERIAKF